MIRFGDPIRHSHLIRDIERILPALGKPHIYYLTHECCPTEIEGVGENLTFGTDLMHAPYKLVAMHPDVLPSFIARAKREGFEPVQFEIEHHYRLLGWDEIVREILQYRTEELVQWLSRLR